MKLPSNGEVVVLLKEFDEEGDLLPIIVPHLKIEYATLVSSY